MQTTDKAAVYVTQTFTFRSKRKQKFHILYDDKPEPEPWYLTHLYAISAAFFFKYPPFILSVLKEVFIS